MKKKVCIIYTGGTIGMVRGPHGYIPSERALFDAMDSMRDLKQGSMPDVDVILFDPLLDSSNMSVCEWNKIGEAISERYDLYDGFVILHGTDTMSYSASALSFMLENLGKPVIFTGSQIPLCELRSDGYANIITSIVIAAQGITNEVCIYFNGKLIRGCRGTKTSSNRFAAFDSPNYGFLADAGIEIVYRQGYCPPKRSGAFHLTKLENIPVGIIKMFPGIQFSIFESVMTSQLRGVVLETFGAGNVPTSSGGDLIPIIKKAYRNGTLVVVCSQCIQGTVSLGAYEASRSLIDIGAVSGGDMTTEASMTKLLYLFSKGYSVEEVSRRMTEDMCGEISG